MENSDGGRAGPELAWPAPMVPYWRLTTRFGARTGPQWATNGQAVESIFGRYLELLWARARTLEAPICTGALVLQDLSEF